MTRLSRHLLSDLRGATRLAVEATEGVTSAVEGMHGAIQNLSLPWGRSAPAPAGLSGIVYQIVKQTTRLVGKGLDAGFESLATILPPGESSPRREAYRSAVNGLCGDHLHRTGNPLAIEMSLRLDGREVSLLDPGRAFIETRGSGPGQRMLLLVHGLCLNDRHWSREGHDHGAALAADFGFSPLYLRYNSGRPVAANGRDLASLLEVLDQRWPIAVDEIVMLGHSMGGLVARSACHEAEAAGHGWLPKLRKMIFLGTPHLGAPLEKGGHQ
ncbi:MAG: GPI inositol-deacylase, partial [Holophagales bacterium]|nr:GPI inositol-deacylase [Holophagales bacterium]